MDFPKVDGTELVSGGMIEIPICECGCTPDAWVHDDRNDACHPFRRIERTGQRGAYAVTANGSAGKPWVATRGARPLSLAVETPRAHRSRP